MVAESSALAAARATRTGFLPSLSDRIPTNGVTRMTTTAAAVESQSEVASLSAPADVMKAGA